MSFYGLKLTSGVFYSAGLWWLLIAGLNHVHAQVDQVDKAPLFKKARRYTLGPKIGLNRQDVRFYQSDQQVGKYLLDAGGRGTVEYHVGIFGRRDFRRWYAQIEVLYSRDVNSALAYNLEPAPFPYGFQLASYLYEYQRIDVPLLVGYRSNQWLRWSAGLSNGGYFYEKYPPSRREDYRIFDDVGSGLHKIILSYRLGAEVEVKGFLFGLTYEGSITNVSDQIHHQGQTYAFKQKARQYLLSVSYKLLKF